MQSIFLGYGKGEDPNSWVLFIGDDINTDASPTNPGRFYGGASYMALEVDNQGNYLVGSTRYQSSSVNGLLYLSKISNIKIKEVPLKLRYDFKIGESKLKVTRNIFKTLLVILRNRLN